MHCLLINQCLMFKYKICFLNVTFTGCFNREIMMDLVALSQKKSLDLKKHVGLIHSTNKLSLLERKIANALLYNAYENLQTQSEHQIHLKVLCTLIGYNSKDYKTIKRSLIALISTVLEWNIIDHNRSEKDAIWMASSILSDAKIEGAVCTYSYSNRMKELCYYPEFYGKINIKLLSKFKSTYGLALYENCIRYQNISQTPWLEMSIYRKLMGIEDGKYEIFRDLNKRVITLSVSEVNKHSPINVKPEFKKIGKSVVAIRFLIQRKITDSECINSVQIEDTNSTNKLLIHQWGFSAKRADEILQQYDEKDILEKITLIESSASFKNGKIEFLAKYLEKALEDNYQRPKNSRDNLEKIKIKQEKEAQLKNMFEQKMQSYRMYQSKILPEMLKTLSTKDKAELEKKFDQYISKTLYYNAYLKEGLENPLVRDKFGDFIRSTNDKLLLSILSFEEFCQGKRDEQL